MRRQDEVELALVVDHVDPGVHLGHADPGLAVGLHGERAAVLVDHGEGLFSLYAHLSEVLVDQGHELLVGEVLGKVGSTGRSTGAHLHLSVRLLGERIDPLALLRLVVD